MGDQSFYKYFVFDRHYGGDLQGLQEQLPYLKSLGVNAIYLNPIFQASTHHKYNATDFRHIDEHYGAGEPDFAETMAQEDLTDPSSKSSPGFRSGERVVKSAMAT